jgi:stage II sporulation protein D
MGEIPSRGEASARTPGRLIGLAVAALATYVAASRVTASVERAQEVEPPTPRPLAAPAPRPDGLAALDWLAPEPRLRVGLPGASRVSIAADSGVLVFPLGRRSEPAGRGYALPRASFAAGGRGSSPLRPPLLLAAAGTPAEPPTSRLRLIEASLELHAARVVPVGLADVLATGDHSYRGYLEVRAGDDGLGVVNVVNVEDYLRGVVPNELSPLAAPKLEAMKAQAVAARTYALRHRSEHAARDYDICATAACQVYHGASSEHPLSDQAVAETRGMLLHYRGSPIDALYTSNCGGHTEDGENIFEGEDNAPYLRGVVCAPEGRAAIPTSGGAVSTRRSAREGRWRVRLSSTEVARAVSRYGTLSSVRDLEPRRLGVSGRVVELAVLGPQREEVVLRGLAVRRGLGLRESLFVLDRETDAAGQVRGFVFSGRGWGHGVGLCQAGMLGMARAGASYEQILTHYYTGVTLRKAY